MSYEAASMPAPTLAGSSARARLLGPPLDLGHPALTAILIALGAGAAIGADLALGPLPATGAIGATLCGLLVLRHPLAGAYLLVAVVPISSGLRRDLPVPGLRISELVIVGLASLLLVSLETRRTRPWTVVDWCALAYCVATLGLGAAALLGRGAPLTLEHLSTLVGPFQFFLLYRAVLGVIQTEEQRRRALALVLLASVPVSLLALLDFVEVAGIGAKLARATGADALALHAQQAGIELRTTGPFPHWQMLTGYLFVIVVLAVVVQLAPGRGPLPGWLTTAVALLAGGAMIATGTFVTAFGALGAALVLGVWYRRLGRVTAVLTAMAIAAATVFGSLVADRVAFSFSATPGSDRGALVPQSVDYRVDLWSNELLPALSGRWLTGFGPDLPAGLSFTHTESMYLTLLFRGGVPLLLVYTGLMLALAGAA